MKNKYLGSSWREMEADLKAQGYITDEEMQESNLRVALILELIDARQKQGISQHELETLSGIRRPVISRIETGKTDPQISTVQKLLAPLGKTLAIVPLER